MADALGSDSSLLGSTASGFTYGGRASKKKTRGLMIALCTITILIAGIIAVIYVAGGTSSSSSNDGPTPSPSDYVLHGSHINVQQISKISTFRSSVGGDFPGKAYSPNETCGSFKHWFAPFNNLDFTKVLVFSPISGEIFHIQFSKGQNSSWGWDILIFGSSPLSNHEFIVTIGFVNITDHNRIQEGNTVNYGDQLGHHIGNFTYSDIAVQNVTSGDYISMFRVLDNDAMKQFQLWNITNRTYPIISDRQRKQYPLNCTGDGTMAGAPIINDTNNGFPYPNWRILNTSSSLTKNKKEISIKKGY